MLKYIFFDLDGTLLPMDQEEFTSAYFLALTKHLKPLGFDPKAVVDGIWKGTYAMVKNDNRASNETVFWQTFSDIFGKEILDCKSLFDEFYKTAFNGVEKVCSPVSEAAETVAELKNRGYSLVLASNPIFPLEGQKARMRWAGVNPDDFIYISSYENSGYSKPNPEYYRQIMFNLGANAAKCLMVGNDVNEDMAAEIAEMKVFLMPKCLINKSNKDISAYPKGDFGDLLAYVKSFE